MVEPVSAFSFYKQPSSTTKTTTTTEKKSKNKIQKQGISVNVNKGKMKKKTNSNKSNRKVPGLSKHHPPTIKKKTKNPQASVSMAKKKLLKNNIKNQSLKPNIASNKQNKQLKPNNQQTNSNLKVQSNLIPSSSIFDADDSIKRGQDMFKWIINPIDLDKFMSENWERTPLLIQRKCKTFYSDLLSLDGFYQMLCDNRVEFTKNLDITSYRDGQRETHNPEGRALPPIVRDFYEDGCSIRMLNPQTFITKIHAMNSTLQEYFQCMTGANVYITPPKSQGFAPHYDDIEAFVLQIEGKKHWRLYKPRTEDEYLARHSSRNFQQDEIGEPILDVILEAGDLLYFPRGTIHQATTVPGLHSVHITLSVYQKQSYGDLLENLLPLALQNAIAQDINFRQGLPLNIWQNMGIVNMDKNSIDRKQIERKIRNLFSSLVKYLPIDDAVDRMAIRYQHDALPPLLSTREKPKTVYGSGARKESIEIHPELSIRLIRANILRLVQYDQELRVYFYVDNSKEYHEYEENYLQVNQDDAAAIKILINSYPNCIQVQQLQLDSDERNVAVAQDLWDRGLLAIEE